jgi:hypothetical protein
VHAGLASVDLEEMSGNHAHCDYESADYYEDQNGLNEIKRPTFHGLEDILGKGIDGGSGCIEVIGVHGETLQIDIGVCLDGVG